MTAYDLTPVRLQTPETDRLHIVTGDISDEDSIELCIEQAQRRFGPIHILIANVGITDESQAYPIWDLPVDVLDKTYRTNIRGTFLTIKHFLRAAKRAQESQGGRELDNLAIVITSSEPTKPGEVGYSSFAYGEGGLQYGLIQSLKNEILRLNRKSRVNSVVPSPVENVARAMTFLASNSAAGHISGQCITLEEGRLTWKENEVLKTVDLPAPSSLQTISRSMPKPPRNKIRVAVSIDLDAVSGWLGTGTGAS